MGYAATKSFSEQRLQELREKIPSVVPTGELVVACGSYGRKEAVSDSDLDFFTVSGGDTDEPPWFPALEGEVVAVGAKLPSREGAFSKVVSASDFLKNYGGNQDTNDSITRRMLYLIEGVYLTEQEKFSELRRKVIETYVRNTPRDHQIAFFLLNDLIRYWRTIAVDYANKTSQIEHVKPWAIRNVKLVFSRKLIYAGGLFSVALTADRRQDKKVEILENLLAMPPVDRIKHICGDSRSKRLFEMYDLFLDKMSDNSVRDHLKKLADEKRANDPIFRDLKNEGHYFSRELMSLFHRTFHASHPIHMAVVF